ncbi:MAG: glycosyltransferase family 39 protein [Marinibacterium sp.]|nr:glycosyltransferase family 39 protein [Marinibacterium sp.]
MQKNAALRPTPDPRLAGIAIVAAVTLYRVLLLPHATADLFVDEAQYWLWGEELAFGYYSKPPLIGWVIRAFTELGGSDAAFWIRLPGPLFHGATALILMGFARRIMDPWPAVLAGLVYLTMPAVALASLLISTDTILLPFFAGALWLWLLLVDRDRPGIALALGICLGLGMMAKYAAIYFILCSALAMLFVPQARIGWRSVLMAALGFGLVILPNVIWNLQNDLVTLSHTADNVDWVNEPGISLNVSGALEFIGGQFGVLGPVFFAAYLLVVPMALRSADWTRRWLVWMSLPILLLVVGQALLSKAFANWAATAYAAGIPLVVAMLWDRAGWARRAIWAGLAINGALALALPVVATQITSWTHEDGAPVLRNYTGRAELSRQIIDAAHETGADAVVAAHRHVLSDLFHTARDSDVTIYAEPPQGYVPHYYAQKHALPADRVAPVLLVSFDPAPDACNRATPDLRWAAPQGAHRGRPVYAYLVDPDCLRGPK